jgi:5,10-methylenetetrahydromethanopterin reductase
MSLRIGLNGGGGYAQVEDAIAHAQGAHRDGFASYWLSQVFGVDALTTLALIAREVPELELGVAVVPTYPRHPTALAVQAQTVQQAAGGRLLLGIGPSHARAVDDLWGLDWSRPYSHTAEYFEILRALLDGEAVDHRGELLTTRGQLAATAPRTPILVAGLGPRIVAGLPFCVTDDPERARTHAAEKLAIYGLLPSYRAMLEREGVKGPADICEIGDEKQVWEALDDLADMGVTDLRATELAPTSEDGERTRALLRSRVRR